MLDHDSFFQVRTLTCLSKVVHEGPSPGSTLVIGVAEESDAGVYVCEMASQNQMQIKHVVHVRGERACKS